MPATTQDYSNIKKNQDKAADLNMQAAGAVGAAGTLGDNVMEAIRADRVKRGVSKLATDVGNVSGQLVSDPQGIRDRTRGEVDPFSVNALTSQARAQNLRTLGTISTQQQQTQGTIDETVQAGANKLKARAAELLAEAESEMTKASSLEQEYQRDLQERKFAADEKQRGVANARSDVGEDTVLKDFDEDLADLRARGMKDADLITFMANLYPEFSEEQLKQLIGFQEPVAPEELQTGGKFPGQGAVELWQRIYESNLAKNLRSNVKSGATKWAGGN